jgi:DNA-binding MarR family transcriptional regulator
VQRAESAGLLERDRDRDDQRLQHLRLTSTGRERLETVTRQHLPRIMALASTLERVVELEHGVASGQRT